MRISAKLRLISYVEQKRNKTSALPSFRKSYGLFPITFVETGFFQSEDFFDKNKIDLVIKEQYINEAKDFFAKLPENVTKVFVHVRRGDYVYESYLGIKGIDLPENYFRKAIAEITKDVKNPFFIFLTDDSNYVKSCFKDIQNKVISNNSMGTDLAIMTLCEYGVVSNSSFSWWGAYLMKNRKKVIFPKYWYGWKVKIESHIGIQPEWAQILEVEE